MKIETLKDLSKLIHLCQKQGVVQIKLGELELKLEPIDFIEKPTKSKESSLIHEFIPPNVITEDTSIKTDALTPEQLLFYSARDASEVI